MCILFTEQRSYPSDVTDAQWAILEPLISTAKADGHRQEISRREIVNGIFYVLPSGYLWQMILMIFSTGPPSYLSFSSSGSGMGHGNVLSRLTRASPSLWPVYTPSNP